MMVVAATEKLSSDIEVRFAALVHDLGKATTETARLPSHNGHEQRGCKLIKKMAERLPVPRACRDLALIVAEYHTHCHRAFELRDDTVVRVLEKTDAFRRPERFGQFLLACEADARGRLGFEQRDYPQAGHLRCAYEAACSVDAASIAGENADQDIPEAIKNARIAAVREFRKTR
jgi:tRNA nucleotidyltransferase (CCA-adding enzyme)